MERAKNRIRTTRVSRIVLTRRASRDSLEAAKPGTPPLPARAWLRHWEVALAALLWASAPPLLLLLPPGRLLAPAGGLVLAVLMALVVHAFMLRPFCKEVPPEAEEEGAGEEAAADEGTAARDQLEELKLMATCLVLLSAVGSVLCLALGGHGALRAWLAADAGGCSAAELQRLAEAGYAKFFCDDGFVDLSKQASLLRRAPGFTGGMRTYRAAPVYAERGSGAGAPVAWAVARDRHLSPEPCGPGAGLCGLLVSLDGGGCGSSLVCLSPEERRGFTELQGVIRKELHAPGGAAGSGPSDLPVLLLTDPRDPEGNSRHLFRAIGMWALALLGLLWALADAVADGCGRGAAGQGGQPGYARLQEEEFSRSRGSAMSASSDSQTTS